MLNHGNMSRGMLWMGSAGVIAQTHHDRSYNLFAQIAGRKALYLWPPESGRLNMHPSYHGSRRQSQISHPAQRIRRRAFKKGNGSVDPVPGCSESDNVCRESTDAHSRQHGGMEFFLNPSDVLYVPPFWFHTVVSLSRMTVSYSVLSPSREEYHFADALYAQVPFGVLSNDPPRILRIAVAATST